MLPSSTAPSPPRVALLNRASAGASSLMSPSTMLPRPRPIVRPLKLATPCCPTASLLLATGLVAILLFATDFYQHGNLPGLWIRNENEIAIVTHSVFLFHNLNGFGNDCNPLVKKEISKQ
ncbi:hypothetical protein AHAS_Ahas02G0032700 [Arachis hypogaea]